MTPPPPPSCEPPAAPGRGGQDAVWAWLRGLGVARSDDDRWVAGVAGGTAARLGVDPVLARAGFVLLVIFGGLGVPLYLLAWALLPDQRGSIVAEKAVRHRDRRSMVLLVVVAAVVLGSVGGRWWWSLLPVAGIAWWVHRSRATTPPTTHEVPAWTSPVTSSPAPYAASSPTTTTTPVSPASPASTEATAAWGDPLVARPPGAPYGMGPGRTGAVWAAPDPVSVVPRARRRRGGVLGLLLAVGLGVAGAAASSGVLEAWRESGGRPPGLQPVPFMLACALAGVALALVLIGLLGRRAGFTALLALVLAVVTVAAASVPSYVLSTGTGDRTWLASQQTAGSGDYVVGLGDGRLDLTGATAGQQFDVRVGMGDLTVVVPPGVTATIEPSLGIGDLTVVRDGDRQTSGPATRRVVGDGATAVTVRASLMAGDLIVLEAPASAPTPSGSVS